MARWSTGSAQAVRTNFLRHQFSYPSDPDNDPRSRKAIKRSGAVTPSSRFKVGPAQGTKLDSQPLPEFMKYQSKRR